MRRKHLLSCSVTHSSCQVQLESEPFAERGELLLLLLLPMMKIEETCCFFPLTKSLSKLRSILSQESDNQPLSLKCYFISSCTPLPSEIILIKRCNDCEDKPSSTRQHCRHVDSSDCEANYSKPRLTKTLFLDSSTIQIMVKIHVDLKIRKEIITRTRNMFMDHWMSERESTRVLDLSLSPNTKKCMKSSLSLAFGTGHM